MSLARAVSRALQNFKNQKSGKSAQTRGKPLRRTSRGPPGDLPSDYRRALALEQQFTALSVGKVGHDGIEGFLRDQDFTWGSFALQPRGDVDGIAQDRVIGDLTAADIAHECLPRGDAYAYTEAFLLRRFCHRAHDFQGRHNGASRVVFVVERRAEERHHLIAN